MVLPSRGRPRWRLGVLRWTRLGDSTRQDDGGTVVTAVCAGDVQEMEEEVWWRVDASAVHNRGGLPWSTPGLDGYG